RRFSDGPAVATAGFNQDYLGPTILVQNGDFAAEVTNRLDEPVSAHWHGRLVPGEHDGGPHLAIAPGATRRPEIAISQESATAWYHTHIHERTAAQVYSGLAGVIHVTDGRDDQRGRPRRMRAGRAARQAQRSVRSARRCPRRSSRRCPWPPRPAG
ncbi:MAG: multicopper oxidase domain-containing protein, partial [Hoeflea sp.]|nr:multicopper oxidase domain-containing protein [Hoeflea sp.]